MAWKEIQTKELNNGRLAMIAIAAFTAEELVSKQEIFEHLALRFEKEAILELDDLERDVGIKNVSGDVRLVGWVVSTAALFGGGLEGWVEECYLLLPTGGASGVSGSH